MVIQVQIASILFEYGFRYDLKRISFYASIFFRMKYLQTRSARDIMGFFFRMKYLRTTSGRDIMGFF